MTKTEIERAAVRVETRAVLAGAYRGGVRACRTHAVFIMADGSEHCGCRVPVDSLADEFALGEAERRQRPTCKTCARRWARSARVVECYQCRGSGLAAIVGRCAVCAGVGRLAAAR